MLAAHWHLSLRTGDAWFVREAHRAAREADDPALRRVAEDDLASRPSSTQRQATLSLGRNLLRAAAAIALSAEEADVQRVAGALREVTPRATVFGAVTAALGAAEEEAAAGYLYAVLSGMVAAAVRLRVVAALEGQAVLRRVLAKDGAEQAAEWAFFSPLLDIAAMSHETLEPRLFAS